MNGHERRRTYVSDFVNRWPGVRISPSAPIFEFSNDRRRRLQSAPIAVNFGGAGRPIAAPGGSFESDRGQVKSRVGSGPMLAQAAAPGALAAEWHLSGQARSVTRRLWTAPGGGHRSAPQAKMGRLGYRDHCTRWSAPARPLPTDRDGFSASAHSEVELRRQRGTSMWLPLRRSSWHESLAQCRRNPTQPGRSRAKGSSAGLVPTPHRPPGRERHQTRTPGPRPTRLWHDRRPAGSVGSSRSWLVPP